MRLKPLNVGPERFYLFCKGKLYYNLNNKYLHSAINHPLRAGQSAQNASKVLHAYFFHIPLAKFEVRSDQGLVMDGEQFLKEYPVKDTPMDPFDGDSPNMINGEN